MGGVASSSGKSVCQERIQLSRLAIQQWDAFVKAQKNYNDLLEEKIAASITEFVVAYSSDSAAKLQDSTLGGHHEEKNQKHDADQESRSTEKNQKHDADQKTRSTKKNQKHDVDQKSRTVRENDEKMDHDKGAANANVEEKGLLKLALKQVEDQFKKASVSGSTVYKLLVTELTSTDDQGKTTTKGHENSKLPRSSSTKFLFLARSRSTKVRSLACDDCSTVEKLHAWEKHLRFEVKRVENEEKIGGGLEVEIAQESAVSAFNKIQKLRDDELQPQLAKLLKGLKDNWTVMLECHETQNKIMSDMVQSYSEPQGMCCDASHLIATVKLKTQVQNWRAGFTSYISSQKAYIKSLDDWSKHSIPSFCKGKDNNGRTPLLADWLACLHELPDKAVVSAMDEFDKQVEKLVEQQKKERALKSQVDKLNEQICRLVPKTEASSSSNKLNELRKRLTKEEEAYQTSKKNTQDIAANVVRVRFTSVFQSLAEFSKIVAKKYGEIAEKYGDRDC